MLYDEMRLKKSGSVVRVYAIENNIATIFDPEYHIKCNNGWRQVKITMLVPIDFPPFWSRICF